jgi:retron-type reverse transcriptase
MLKYNAEGKCVNAFEVMSQAGILREAYETIKSKSGNMVPGPDKETLDGITTAWFPRTSGNLLKESFQPRPSRRVYIPKANGKMRPLGISPPRDKIVQQSMRIAMEMVLEPVFLETSHGFRPKRGCHTALAEIRS